MDSDPDRHQKYVVDWPIANLPWKLDAKLLGSFCAKLLADKQTNKQTNKQRRLHILLGGGKYRNMLCRANSRMSTKRTMSHQWSSNSLLIGSQPQIIGEGGCNLQLHNRTDFVPGYYTARCVPPTNGSASQVVIANAPGAQSAATVYDKVRQRGAPWWIPWKFMTAWSNAAVT